MSFKKTERQRKWVIYRFIPWTSTIGMPFLSSMYIKMGNIEGWLIILSQGCL